MKTAGDLLRMLRCLSARSPQGRPANRVSWDSCCAGRYSICVPARDWLAKLHLVAAGCGLTTVPATLASAAPSGVLILPVRGGPQEQRRLLLARLPHPPTEPVIRVAAALRAAALNAPDADAAPGA